MCANYLLSTKVKWIALGLWRGSRGGCAVQEVSPVITTTGTITGRPSRAIRAAELDENLYDYAPLFCAEHGTMRAGAWAEWMRHSPDEATSNGWDASSRLVVLVSIGKLKPIPHAKPYAAPEILRQTGEPGL